VTEPGAVIEHHRGFPSRADGRLDSIIDLIGLVPLAEGHRAVGKQPRRGDTKDGIDPFGVLACRTSHCLTRELSPLRPVKSKNATTIIELLVRLCFRSACQNVRRCRAMASRTLEAGP